MTPKIHPPRLPRRYPRPMIDLGTIAGLHERPHTLAAYCTRRRDRNPGAGPQQFEPPNRDRGRSSLIGPLPHHPACGSAPGGSSG
jgi:hypothetical protein